MVDFGTKNSSKRKAWYSEVFGPLSGLTLDVGAPYKPIGSGDRWNNLSLFQHDLSSSANANKGYSTYLKVTDNWKAVAAALGLDYDKAKAWESRTKAKDYLAELKGIAEGAGLTGQTLPSGYDPPTEELTDEEIIEQELGLDYLDDDDEDDGDDWDDGDPPEEEGMNPALKWGLIGGGVLLAGVTAVVLVKRSGKKGGQGALRLPRPPSQRNCADPVDCYDVSTSYRY